MPAYENLKVFRTSSLHFCSNCRHQMQIVNEFYCSHRSANLFNIITGDPTIPPCGEVRTCYKINPKIDVCTLFEPHPETDSTTEA